MKRLVTAVVLGVVAFVAVVQLEAGGSSSPVVASPAVATASSSAPPGSSAPSPTPSAGPPDAAAQVPIVPVTQFRSPADGTTLAEVRSTLAGTSARYWALELVADEADPILGALGLDRPTDSAHLVEARDLATLEADLVAHRDRLAFVRADEVAPTVRALAWGGVSLFGVERVRDLREWPLMARLPARQPGSTAFVETAVWTLVGGGDILLDRGVAQAVRTTGQGDADFPFRGGVARIVGRSCCSVMGWVIPNATRAGAIPGVGDMAAYLRSADLTFANFENPAPDRFRFHASGTIFSADPALIAGLRDAGIDWVSLANNHIRDAGADGVVETSRNLARFGIASSGAGADLARARRPAFFRRAGVTIAVLGYDAISLPAVAAGPARAGAAPLTEAILRVDIADARRAGADVVIVYPHWGVEYTARPTAGQRGLAHAMIDAGADLVIGNHPHWAGAMEVYRGRPVWYALGNFVFDQTWSEQTMEGITLELTFRGATLVQARLRPHVILDAVQPNLLDPAGDGRPILRQVFAASAGLLAW